MDELSPFILGDFINHLILADDIYFIFQYFVIFGGINLASVGLGYIA